MKLPIFLYGSHVLREPAAEADLEKKDDIRALIADMKETLASADGCGLAAPQVGVPTRILIVDGRELVDAQLFGVFEKFTYTVGDPELHFCPRRHTRR